MAIHKFVLTSNIPHPCMFHIQCQGGPCLLIWILLPKPKRNDLGQIHGVRIRDGSSSMSA